MRIPAWTPQSAPRSPELVDAIKRRRGGKLINLDLALLWSEKLRIVQPFRYPRGIENDGRRHYRARQRSAAGLVAAGDERMTASIGVGLAGEGRPL